MTPPLILEGLAHWRKREYLEAHEAWETHWHTIRKDRGRREESDYTKGMIQLAVALVHHGRGNERWHKKLLESGTALLNSIEGPYPAISRERLIEEAKLK
jgi:predicted metal-dependent hydrolase